MTTRSRPRRAPSAGRRWPVAAATLALAPAIAFVVAAARGLHPLAPSVPELLRSGASWGPLTLDDEPWRLATAAVCHAGVRHLASNVVVLALAGAALERLVGRGHLLLTFVAAAVVGAAAATTASPLTVIAGASSGALGVATALAIATARGGDAVSRRLRRAIAAGLALLVGYHVLLATTRDDIDVVGHGVGILTGLALGLAGASRRATWASAIAAMSAIAVLLVVGRPAPEDPRQVPRQVIAIDRRFDQLVGPATAPTPRTDALARALVAEVAEPLEALAAAHPRDAELPPRLAAGILRMRRYAGARAAVVRLFVRYLRDPDPALLPEIERATRAADALLDATR